MWLRAVPSLNRLLKYGLGRRRGRRALARARAIELPGRGVWRSQASSGSTNRHDSMQGSSSPCPWSPVPAPVLVPLQLSLASLSLCSRVRRLRLVSTDDDCRIPPSPEVERARGCTGAGMRLPSEGMRRRSVDEKDCVLGSIHLDGEWVDEKLLSASDRTGHDRFHARRSRVDCGELQANSSIGSLGWRATSQVEGIDTRTVDEDGKLRRSFCCFLLSDPRLILQD